MSTDARATLALVISLVAAAGALRSAWRYYRRPRRPETIADLWDRAPEGAILTSTGYAVNPREVDGRWLVDAYEPGRRRPVTFEVVEP